MGQAIYRCAELHLRNLAGGPAGSARPLDFGHWAAHKLEQLSDFRLRHGEAVAIGVALDTTYSYLEGLISEDDWTRVIATLSVLGFQLFVPELRSRLNDPEEPHSLLRGLSEFREQLGGPLTITLLRRVGEGVDMPRILPEVVRRAVSLLETLYARPSRARPAAA